MTSNFIIVSMNSVHIDQMLAPNVKPLLTWSHGSLLQTSCHTLQIGLLIYQGRCFSDKIIYHIFKCIFACISFYSGPLHNIFQLDLHKIMQHILL